MIIEIVAVVNGDLEKRGLIKVTRTSTLVNNVDITMIIVNVVLKNLCQVYSLLVKSLTMIS